MNLADMSDLIAVASAFVSLLALAISVWAGYVAWDHNKRSVLPILHVDKDIRNGTDIELSVLNYGLGPALIKSFSIFCDGKEYIFPDQGQYGVILQALGLDPSANSFTAEIPLKGNVVKADGSFSVIRFVGSGQNAQLHKKIVDVLPRLRIRVIYESIYRQEKRLEFDEQLKG
jgi:hypothetical protein